MFLSINLSTAGHLRTVFFKMTFEELKLFNVNKSEMNEFMKNLNSSTKSIKVMTFQLPFSGLGISLETCAAAAEEMEICYSTYSHTLLMLGDIFSSHVYVSLSGYDLQVTLGQEIRGR